MLHLIADSSLSEALVARIANLDDVVLQAGSAWSAYAGHEGNAQLYQLLSQGCGVYVLKDVCAMQGIELQKLLPGVKAIDYPGLVELTVKHPVIHTWC